MQAKLIVHRDGRKFEKVKTGLLLPGALGNQQTLEEMSKIVREDSRSEDLKRFAKRTLLPGIEKKPRNETLNRIYEFCRDSILYLDDLRGVERVADLWSCLYSLSEFAPVGDCVIKSTALATLLSLFGFEPVFIVSKISERSESFNHVFCGLATTGNQFLRIDPTPEQFQPRQMVSLHVYKIF
jgi:hypothetical protein